MVNKSPLLKLDFVTKVAEILTPFNDGQLIPLVEIVILQMG